LKKKIEKKIVKLEKTNKTNRAIPASPFVRSCPFFFKKNRN
jgi:ribosomal protein L39E